MRKKVIIVKDSFSEHPFGRYPEDGDNNGQRFREEFIIPNLNDEQVLVIDLTGTLGATSSFIEESFGGLIRAGIDYNLIKNHLEVVNVSFRKHEAMAWKYIEREQVRLMEEAN